LRFDPVFGISGIVSGVGSKYEYALPSMGCADVGSAKACPAHVIPDFGQVPENVPESQGKVTCDVFQEHVAGS